MQEYKYNQAGKQKLVESEFHVFLSKSITWAIMTAKCCGTWPWCTSIPVYLRSFTEPVMFGSTIHPLNFQAKEKPTNRAVR